MGSGARKCDPPGMQNTTITDARGRALLEADAGPLRAREAAQHQVSRGLRAGGRAHPRREGRAPCFFACSVIHSSDVFCDLF